MNATFLPVSRLRCRKIAPLLVPYADGGLGRETRARIEAHLNQCADCREEMETITAVAALLRHEAVADSVVAPRPANDLWAGIEAEIIRTGGDRVRTPQTEHAPRRRPAFRLDAFWPNSVPVAVAVFSAFVFAMVLMDRHPAVTSGAVSGISVPSVPSASPLADQPITLAMCPSSSIPALVALNRATVASAGASVANGARAAYVAAHLRPAMARLASARPERIARHAPILMAEAGTTTHGFTLPDPRPVVLLTRKEKPAAPVHTGLLAQTDVAVRPIVPTYFSATTGTVAGNASVDGAAVSEAPDSAPAPANLGVADAAAAAPPATDATVTLVSASDTSDDAATLRGDSPAAEPMVDLATTSRRQRSLFSYASR